ncbi:hypothetical protein PIB30_028687 [Stylosanthes scabra]|uniref:Uncharacterized protein n=1 Tax=Stylosanthes scabra TaxID=79078 RepID=A0ABU6TAS1_9FABA|nr:hypothetical protein [Stylosanthes scabra]
MRLVWQSPYVSCIASIRKLSIVEEMGNNNATAIKEEDNGHEAEKETHNNDLHHHEDSVKEENEVNSTSKREYADTKSEEEFHVHTTSEPEKDSPQEDKHTDDLKVEMQEVPTAEGKDGEENVTLPSMSKDDSFEEGTNAGDAHMENQKIPTSEGTDAKEIDTMLALDHRKGSDDTEEHVSHGQEQEILEVGQTERSENAESVEDGGEKCEILSSSSLVGTEDHGNQTESTLREDLLITHLDHLESDPKQEEEDTKVLTSVADQVLSESSFPKGDFLDTDPISPQDNDVVIERDTETLENNVSGDLLNKVNVDNSLVHELEENHKVLHAESTSENSLDYNSGECLQEICMFNTSEHDKSPIGPNGDSNGERIEEPISSVSVISTNNDEAERPKENGHQFDDCDDNNPNKTDLDETSSVSEDQNHYLVFPEAEDCTEVRQDYDRKFKEACQNPETSHAAEQVPELLEQCNSHLVTIDHVESFSLQNSDSLLHIYSYQVGNENHTKNQNASSISSSDCEDYSGLVEATSVNDKNHNNNASEDQNHHLVVAEAEAIPLVAVSKIIGCIEEQEEDYKKKIEEETYRIPQVSYATDNGLEDREFLEQCNSHLVTIDHVESFSFQNSNSLLHVYNYQESSEKQFEDYSVIVAAISASEANDHCTEPCPNNSTFENGGYEETRESTSTKTATRFSTESNSDNADICSFQIQKSPSLNLSLQIEESDQSPLLYEDKCSTSEMPMEEEKIVTMERSYTEKSKYSEKDDDDEQGNIAGTYETSEKKVTATMPKSKEKRKAMSSFFINCMCCATVAN